FPQQGVGLSGLFLRGGCAGDRYSQNSSCKDLSHDALGYARTNNEKRIKNPKEKRGQLYVAEFDFVEGHFGQRLGDKLNDMIVVDDLVDVPLVVRTRQDDHLAFVSHHFVELFEFIEEHESIDDGHVDIEKNKTGKVRDLVLVLAKVVERGFA